MCETNALHAYRATVGPITRYAWWVKLADKLVNNPYLTNTEEDNSSDEEIAQEESACGNQWYAGTNAACVGCGHPQKWRCRCGVSCCRAGQSDTDAKKRAKKCPAYFDHLVETLTASRAL